MKKYFLGLLIVLTLAACRLPFAATPKSELEPYYGDPQPAKLILEGKTYDSEVGTTKWIKAVSNGGYAMEIADVFAIVTSREPVRTTSNPLLTLKLPIPIDPTKLWYALFAVTENELHSQDPKAYYYRWQPDNVQQHSLELLAEQPLNLSLEPGTYVLEVHAGWGNSELEADYGFLIEVQE